MSAIQNIEKAKDLIQTAELDFNKLAKIHGAVNFEREASFALEILKNSEYLTGIALNNQDSLKRAVTNVAAIGLSLNPVHKLAYLIPRDKKVMLAVSYLGMIKLAVDIGSIKWAQAEVVYEKDEFEERGFGQEPIHKRQPFASDRGAIVGAYCVAKTHDGDFLTTTMSGAELEAIRNRSESYKSGKQSPWLTDTTEMIKKSVIRRAYKLWPMSDGRARLDSAIDVSNDLDPVDFTATQMSLNPSKIEAMAKQQREMLEVLGRAEAQYLTHLTRVCRREIKSLEEMTENEAKASITMLGGMIDVQNAQESKNENAG